MRMLGTASRQAVSGSYNRLSEDGGHRQYEVDNSNLNPLFVKQFQGEGRDFSFLNVTLRHDWWLRDNH